MTRNATATWRKRRTRRQLGLENLEAREVKTAGMSIVGSELTLTADSNGSRIYVQDLNPMNQTNLPPLLLVQTYSSDANWSTTIPKQGIRTVKFVGSEKADTFQLNTTNSFQGYFYPYAPYLPIVGNIDGRGGDDSLTGGAGDDRILGGLGHDDIWGSGGNDTIEGGSGNDDIYAGHGNDVVLGGADQDWIEGQEGNDQLFGGSGTDFIYGGYGMDGLFGGTGVDHLHGGPDPDRFLIRTNETGTFPQTFDGTTVLLADWVQDDTTQDIRVRFTDEGARTVTWPEGYSPSTTTYSAGTWSEREIQLVDQALGAVAKETANNALLYKPGGGEPQLYRLGNASNNYIAFNDGAGDTHYSNQSFTIGGLTNDNWARQVVLHEFGHNWDTPEEADRLIRAWGPAVVSVFRDESGWTQTRPSDSSNYLQSGDGKWWHRKDAEFTRSYARMNPFEDYAESFSAYFMEAGGWNFVGGVGGDGIPGKMDVLKSWVTLTSYLGAEGRPVGAGGTAGNPSAQAIPAAGEVAVTGPVVLAQSSATNVFAPHANRDTVQSLRRHQAAGETEFASGGVAKSLSRHVVNDSYFSALGDEDEVDSIEERYSHSIDDLLAAMSKSSLGRMEQYA